MGSRKLNLGLLVLGVLLACWPDGAMGQTRKEQAGKKAAGGNQVQVQATGRALPALRSFDKMMFDFMAKHHVPGASLAVARNGRLVYARGFGHADVETRQPVLPASLFRIASVSKPFTATAVFQLVDQGKLKLSDRMVQVLGLAPHGLKADARLERVTILELLQHRGGWDRDKSFDPMFIPLKIARAVDVPPPPGPQAIVQYMMGMPLDFNPGQRYAYSNFGYCVLGRVIERVSGQPYERYVQQHVLGPLGIRDMRIGHTLPAGRAPGEVRYYDSQNQIVKGVVGETMGKDVPEPDGGWFLEAMEAHGGWIASAVDLVRFGSAFDNPERCAILGPEAIATMFARPPEPGGATAKKKRAESYYACGWDIVEVGPHRINTWHTGLLDGTSSILVRRFDGLVWAVLFNSDGDPKDPKGDDLAGRIDGLVHEAADAVTEWPEIDLFPGFLERQQVGPKTRAKAKKN
jgi:CubicO group peptidase (beta-lactamase class C family)